MAEIKSIKLEDLLKCACDSNKDILIKLFNIRQEIKPEDCPEDSYSLSGSSEIMRQFAPTQRKQLIKVKPIMPKDPIPIESIHTKKYKPKRKYPKKNSQIENPKI